MLFKYTIDLHVSSSCTRQLLVNSSSSLKYNVSICPATSSVRRLVSSNQLISQYSLEDKKSITLHTVQRSDEICINERVSKWHCKRFIIAAQVTVIYNVIL